MLFIVFLFGLIIGSFINVLIYRLPREENIYFSRSACPECKKEISAKDLIPILSYFFLRGRCRNCGVKISPRYPAIELITGLGLTGVFWALGFTWQGFAIGLLFLLLLPAAVIDWEHYILPDEITLTGLVAGLVLAIFGTHLGFFEAFLGILLGGGSLLLLSLVYPSGMGGGDVKLMAMVGSFIGWQFALGAIFIGALLGIIYYIIGNKVLGKMDRTTPIPFGSLLAPGSFIAFFWGYRIWEWYINLLI